tara:strand:- start:713 stop:1138 length:426 start_codon:yes stop_codon:yes gene_type:complete
MNEDTWLCVIEQYGSGFVNLSLVSKYFSDIVKKYVLYLENNCQPIIYKKFGYEFFVTQKIKKYVGWCIKCKTFFRDKAISEKIDSSRVWADKKCIIDTVGPRLIEINIQNYKRRNIVTVYKKRIIIPKCWETLYFKKQQFV